MKFNGNSWVNVGNAGFSAGIVQDLSLAFNPSGHPYVAYQDCGDSCKAIVVKFDGNSWVNVGNLGFSEAAADYTSLAFSPSGQPYVAFEDCGDSLKATVMKYDSVFGGINELGELELTLYPNPTKINMTIEFKDKIKIIKDIEIYNSIGQKVFEIKSNQEKFFLNVGNYPKGIYFVKVKADTAIYFEKFTKI